MSNCCYPNVFLRWYATFAIFRKG